MGIRPRVLVTHAAEKEIRLIYQDCLGDAADIEFLTDIRPADRDAALARAEAVACSILVNELSADQIALLKGLRFLQTLASGMEWMPFDKLPPNTLVANNAGVNADAIAEHALALMLGCAKRLLPGHRELTDGKCVRSRVSRTLRGAVCGILGFGGIGREVGRLARQLGMRVMAINRSGRSEEPAEFIGTLADLPRVLTEADFLVIALPTSVATQGAIGAGELARMKRDAILVNVSRANIVDEEALYRHLQDHQEFYAAFDVWWTEPYSHGEFRPRWPLFDLPNFIGTPHLAAFVDGFFAERARQAAANVRRYIDGARPANLVSAHA